MRGIKKIISDKEGGSAVEYALLLAVLGGGMSLAVVGLGNAVKTEMSRQALAMNGSPSAGTGTGQTGTGQTGTGQTGTGQTGTGQTGTGQTGTGQTSSGPGNSNGGANSNGGGRGH